MRFSRAACVGIAGGILVGVALGIWPVSVSRAKTFVCDITGSRYGYRTYPLGIVVNRWSRLSPLEQWARDRGIQPAHRWRCVASTGKNLFGSSVEFGCGPVIGAANVSFPKQQAWIERHSEVQVKELMDYFAKPTGMDKSNERAEQVNREAEGFLSGQMN